MFKELSSNDLLSKRLHGKTQNANQALNNIIWQKCPRNVFVQRGMLEVVVNSVVIEFNDGLCGIYKVLDFIAINSGCLIVQSSKRRTLRQISNIQMKISQAEKAVERSSKV